MLVFPVTQPEMSNMRLKAFYITCLMMSLHLTGVSQVNQETQEGRVTFVTAQNVYAQFEHMEEVQPGDTLYQLVGTKKTAILIVLRKSRTSSVCQTLPGYEPKKGDQILHYITIRDETEESLPSPIPTQEDGTKNTPEESRLIRRNLTVAKKQEIHGRVSLASYSLFSSESENRHSALMRFNLNAKRINQSPLSLISSMNYRRNFPVEQSSTRKSAFFRVYNLALSYQSEDDLNVTLGRRINNNYSSLGAIDGLQLEKTWNNISAGVITGFRPDIRDHGFNANQFEYGAFLGLNSPRSKRYHRTTIGILEQRSKGAVDRRYTYFQHSSRPLDRLNLFGSFEIDIYRKIGEITGVKPRVTNLYVSARYRLSNKVSFSLSYDSRLRVIYYETLKTEVEQLLEDEARQGFRLSLNARPFNWVYAGVNISTRFQRNETNKSRNINVFMGFRQIPYIDGKFNITFNTNKSDYLESQIFSLRYQRSFGKILTTDVYIRDVSYEYAFNEWQDNQVYYGLNVNLRITRQRSIQLLFERAIRSREVNHRLNARAVNRF